MSDREERPGAVASSDPDATAGSTGATRDSILTIVFRLVVALGCVAVLVYGASGVLGAGRDGVNALSPDPTDGPHGLYNMFECIRGEIEDRVPAGSTVYIGDQAASGSPDLWQQRLAEMTFRQATITDDPTRAQYTVAILPAVDGDSCGGSRLVVTPT